MKTIIILAGKLFIGSLCSSTSQAFVFSNSHPYHVVASSAVTKKRIKPIRPTNNENHYHNTNTATTTQLYDGVIVPIADDFMTITGLALGLTYSLTRSVNRVVLENVAWENRLEDARQKKLDNLDEGDISLYTELDLRRQDADKSNRFYGTKVMEEEGRGGGRVEGKGRSRRVQTKEYGGYDANEVSDRDEGDDRKYTMTDLQILDFEDEYGVEYDPYYDEPYMEDELPDEMTFYKDKTYGDRRYENGEVFYQDEDNKDLYWRQGGRPRLRQFWEGRRK